MGRRGPKPTPLTTLKLRGSPYATKRRLRAEIRGPDGTPDPPTVLKADKRARTAWEQLIPMLEGMGILTRIDSNALARYCLIWSRWQVLASFLREHGDVHPVKDSSSGETLGVKPWPQSVMYNQLTTQLIRLEQEFGMTPSARARLELPHRDEDADSMNKARFFSA